MIEKFSGGLEICLVEYRGDLRSDDVERARVYVAFAAPPGPIVVSWSRI